MTKALLAVSFGTSYGDVADRTIGAIERALVQAFPDRVLYSAWTSGFICRKVESLTGVHHMQVDEVCEAMLADGIDDVLVQPTFLMQSNEYETMRTALLDYALKLGAVRVGDTLLATPDDCTQLAGAIAAEYADLADDEVLLLMGHGSTFGGNEVYGAMQDAFEQAGHGNIVIGTVEGTPDFDAAAATVERLQPKRVLLAPFMIVAGDHANNDLAGSDPESWQSQLESRGFACTPALRGLGEYAQVQALFVAHAQRALVEG